jgi:hypothetical protein
MNCGWLTMGVIHVFALCPKIVNGILVMTLEASILTDVDGLAGWVTELYAGTTYVLGCQLFKKNPMVAAKGGSTGAFIVVSVPVLVLLLSDFLQAWLVKMDKNVNPNRINENNFIFIYFIIINKIKGLPLK